MNFIGEKIDIKRNAHIDRLSEVLEYSIRNKFSNYYGVDYKWVFKKQDFYYITHLIDFVSFKYSWKDTLRCSMYKKLDFKEK